MAATVAALRRLVATHDPPLAKQGTVTELLMQAARLDIITRAQFGAFQAAARGRNAASVKALVWPAQTATSAVRTSNPFGRLPEEVLQTLMARLHGDVKGRAGFATIFNLAATDKWMLSTVQRTLFAPAQGAWSVVQRARPHANADAGQHCKSKHPYVLNMLAGALGCMFCEDAPNTRKVYWEYWVRCCQCCLFKRTIAKYYLESDYHFTKEDLERSPARTAEMYSRGYGCFSCAFYWRADVLGFIKARYGLDSLEAYRAMRDEEARQRALRQAQHLQKLQDLCSAAGLTGRAYTTSGHYRHLEQRVVDITDADIQRIRTEAAPEQARLEQAARTDKHFVRECKAIGIRMKDGKHSSTYRRARPAGDCSRETLMRIRQEIDAALGKTERA